jgi:hypothetical protein
VTIKILEKKSAIGGGSGKVVDSSPNDHIFIYTQTMVALEFSMHSFLLWISKHSLKLPLQPSLHSLLAIMKWSMPCEEYNI